MANKYQEQHYEDVARVLHHARIHEPRFGTGQFTAIGQAIIDFADLFAADNPPVCTHVVVHQDGKCDKPGGFNRERFLKACGLED